jgi:hypothetical protein
MTTRMRRLPAVLAALLLLTPLPALADDRVGPALDLTLGGGALSGPEYGADTMSMMTRAGAGLQLGRYAALAHAEITSFSAAEPSLDSEQLQGTGFGLGVRIELLGGGKTVVQAQLGYTWRDLDGDAAVRRGCDTFSTCTAGFYEETPSYDASGPYAAITVARRTGGRIWPAIGAQLGVSSYPIDRPGGMLDESGALIWLALHLELGTGNQLTPSGR